MNRTTPQYIPVPALNIVLKVPLKAYGSQSACTHLLDRDCALAINAALATGRPLLLRGEPGTGKSQLARAAAALLERNFLLHAVDARTETRDLLYTVDAVSRLAQAQVLGVTRKRGQAALDTIALKRFVRPGPIWWAYEPSSARSCQPNDPPIAKADEEAGVVLLIDEIDKADPSVPNGLLDAFGSGCFHVDGLGTIKVGTQPPLVILTTNEERTLPDAFVRRCLVLHINLPELPLHKAKFVAFLKERALAHFQDPMPDDTVLTSAAELIVKARIDPMRRDHCPPGVAEYLDLVRAVIKLRDTPPEQCKLLDEIEALSTRKHLAERHG